MDNRREFISQWLPSEPMIWAERTEEAMIGSSKGGHLMVPAFTAFDFIPGPNEPVTIVSAPSNRAYVDAPRGTAPLFHRNADFEELCFQMAGETVYETEYGIFTAKPAELILIPAGIAFRVTGLANSLRLVMQVRDQLKTHVKPNEMQGHTEYDVEWIGAPDWPVPPESELFPKGRVTESIHTWDDRPDDETLVERSYEGVVGSIKVGGAIGGPPTNAESIWKVRLFDIFKEMTGKRGPGPISLENDHFFMECYNTVGEQWAYHRANRSEEAQLQFAGAAENINEFGTDLMDSGMLYVQRRGISHRVKGSPMYRRMVFYSKEPWKVMIDPKAPLRHTSFKVTERVLEHAPWRDEIAEYLSTALAR